MKPSDLQKVASQLPLSEDVRRLNAIYGTVEDKHSSPTKRIRQSRDKLNKLESAFQVWITHELSGVFDNPIVEAQSIRFRLGNGVWYKPDFVFIRPSGRWTIYEVKGPKSWRGGFENLKVAASRYPLIQWVLAWKENGMWITQEVLP